MVNMNRKNVCPNHSAIAEGCGRWITQIPYWHLRRNNYFELSLWIKESLKKTTTKSICNRTQRKDPCVCFLTALERQEWFWSGSPCSQLQRQGDGTITNQHSPTLRGDYYEVNFFFPQGGLFSRPNGSFSGPLEKRALSKLHDCHGDKSSRCRDAEVNMGFVCITDRHFSA